MTQEKSHDCIIYKYVNELTKACVDQFYFERNHHIFL